MLPVLAVTHGDTVTRIHAGIEITLPRTPTLTASELVLSGTWPGQEAPSLLATIGQPPHLAPRAHAAQNSVRTRLRRSVTRRSS